MLPVFLDLIIPTPVERVFWSGRRMLPILLGIVIVAVALFFLLRSIRKRK